MQLLFALTLFVSALLLFVVQPMFAKMVLPLLGGSPAVWNTCMVFYQATLLAGYIYAHLSIKWLGPRRQAAVHLVLFCLPWLVLPISRAEGWTPPTEANPIPWLLMLLAVSVGLPFLFVSASAPMLQAWYAATGHRGAKDPYFLYAASNLGSLLALAGYPLLLEPYLRLDEQAGLWAAAYGVLMALSLLCATLLWYSRPAKTRRSGGQGSGDRDQGSGVRSQGSGDRDEAQGGDRGSRLSPVNHPSGIRNHRSSIIDHQSSIINLPGGPPQAVPTWAGRLRWLALALAPSSLMLGVTTYISTDIASVPLLWVVPLGLYLLTFVLVFARHTLLPHRLMVMAQPILVVIVAGAFFVGGTSTSYLAVIFPLHLLTFFVTAMVCHGELAASRPASRYLTEFYLWMSVGGVLGGVLNALVAPLVFNHVYEYPLMIAAACLLRPAGWYGRVARASRRETGETPVPPVHGGGGVSHLRRWAGVASAHPPHRAPPTARWLDWGLPLGVAVGFGSAAVALSRSNHLARWAGWLVDRLSAWGLTNLEVDTDAVAGLAFLGAAALVVFFFRRRPVRFGLGVFALLLVSFLYFGENLRPLYSQRSFFGVLRVRQVAEYDDDGELVCETHQLTHGSTNHGMQRLDPKLRLEPCTYYHRAGPVGQIIDAVLQQRPLRQIGVVGLGTGTIAAYGRPGQRITFYEIDPAVVQIARNPELFTYLSDCQADVEVIVGDARLSLADGPPRLFDLLLIDAFSSDAIPVHLLTREALALYFQRLADQGVLGVHVSNRHLDLEPVLADLAEDAGLVARVCEDGDDRKVGKYASTWVALARRDEDLGQLAHDSRWKPLACRPGSRLWTDHFSNIVDVLNWDVDFSWLCPWK
jgi:hypothetical protein